ncbi:MAG: hypothetical protein LUO89_13750 [Methanothrix sp.]|nr:hypothetical protein [Methanothrix sp.]
MTIAGCSESNFNIAKESRLPKWFSIPAGMSREDLNVTLDYYVAPEKSVYTLYDKNGTKLSVKKGNRYGGYIHPKELKNPPPGFPKGYPSYEIIIVDGIIDIVEHRRMEPIFYMTDDPAIWKEFGVKQ